MVVSKVLVITVSATVLKQPKSPLVAAISMVVEAAEKLHNSQNQLLKQRIEFKKLFLFKWKSVRIYSIITKITNIQGKTVIHKTITFALQHSCTILQKMCTKLRYVNAKWGSSTLIAK